MALAIVEMLGVDRNHVRLRADTGTNSYYQVKLGRSVRERQGIDWVDDVFYATPVKGNSAGGDLLSSWMEIDVPAPNTAEGDAYVQLFSFKTPQGKSPAFSKAVRVHGRVIDMAPAFASSMSQGTGFRKPRRVSWSEAQSYSKQASLDTLLAEIVKLAGPVVLRLLQSKNGAPAPTGGNAPGTPNLLGALLNSLLSNVGGGGAFSTPQSLNRGNRFLRGSKGAYSRPFIAGIDDALLGMLVSGGGQALPLLINAVNSANQQRMAMKQADNKLITDILSETNRRLFLDQLLQAQKPQPVAEGQQPQPAPDLSMLIQLLKQAPAQNGTTTVTPPPPVTPETVQPPPPAEQAVAVTKSLSAEAEAPKPVSARAVLEFLKGAPTQWNGSQKLVLARTSPVELRIRLDVAPPAPKAPLPKAIIKVVFKTRGSAAAPVEKIFKLKNIAAGQIIPLPFTPEELAGVPANQCLDVLAEMRWKSGSGSERSASGSLEAVFVNKYFVLEQGKSGDSPVVELTDMKQFRPFWNKVWESPSLDAASTNGGSDKRLLWELDATMKYVVLLSSAHDANGLLETKVLQGEADTESVTAKTAGRMKAGIELSISELNKLMPLWNGSAPLDNERLEALNTPSFAKANCAEMVQSLRLRGRPRERGMVWAVPVFRLREVTLAVAGAPDASGSVTQTTQEKIYFPLPISVRLLGLKSKQE